MQEASRIPPDTWPRPCKLVCSLLFDNFLICCGCRLSGFLPHASEMGLFLNIPRFRASMMQAHPIGHQSRPAPSLVYTTYLWAIRLSQDPSVKAYESAYLHRATQDAATILSGSHPNKILHSIQTEVLLSTYFFANGRFFEGKYHLSNAVSTVFSAKMHRIRSYEPSQQQATSQAPRMPSPRDSVEEGERILGLWTVLTLDKTWAIALENSPNFEHSTHALATRVDTPWPLEMEDFEQVFLFIHCSLFRFENSYILFSIEGSTSSTGPHCSNYPQFPRWCANP